ncbi:unnamed protein product [Brassica oleracea]
MQLQLHLGHVLQSLSLSQTMVCWWLNHNKRTENASNRHNMKMKLQLQLQKVSKIQNPISKPCYQILSILIFDVKEYVSIRSESAKLLRYMKQKQKQNQRTEIEQDECNINRDRGRDSSQQ